MLGEPLLYPECTLPQYWGPGGAPEDVQMIPLEHVLVLSALLFSLGVYGVLARRNAVLILMSVELMLQGVNINFIAFAVYLAPDRITGLVFAVFVIVVAAAEVGLALAIVLRVYRNEHTADVDEVDLMKW